MKLHCLMDGGRKYMKFWLVDHGHNSDILGYLMLGYFFRLG